jgi:uncharacterized protein YndB with AHSA1/START domain
MSNPSTTGDVELRTSRHLPATPEEVFDAYTDAEKQKIWFSILDEEPGIVEIEVDLRVGGQQVAVWGPSKDMRCRETQTFLEIDRPHRLVTQSEGSAPDGQTMTTPTPNMRPAKAPHAKPKRKPQTPTSRNDNCPGGERLSTARLSGWLGLSVVLVALPEAQAGVDEPSYIPTAACRVAHLGYRWPPVGRLHR